MESRKRTGILGACILIGLGLALALSITLSHQAGQAAIVNEGKAGDALGDYIVLAWNDLGMHCLNADFADLAILPPYNTLWAQVIRRGPEPEFVTTGITVTYVFTDNTYSVGKTNFWSYEDALFGVNLPDNLGLTGRGLSGEMTLDGNHFIAEGIPLTEFSDSAPGTPQPFQLATIQVRDQSTGDLLAESVTVAPVSSEMRCDTCHSDTGEVSLEHGIATGKTETNILTLHDNENFEDYPAGFGLLMDNRPVLCAGCHASNALGAPGQPGLPSLSNAIHSLHGEEEAEMACYNCHPGPQTQCLRDVMSFEHGMTCLDCHGNMLAVGQNANPWLNEPRCDSTTCHGNVVLQDHPLYRFSSGHFGIACEGCHDSTHAIAPSREPNDSLKFSAWQGAPGPLGDCTACHTIPMNIGDFRHDSFVRIYLPVLIR